MTFIETQDIHDARAEGHRTACGPPRSDAWTPDPTPQQLWNLIWVSIIHGAKGLSYFHHFCPIPENNIKVLAITKAYIHDLAQVILAPDSKLPVKMNVSDGGRIDILPKDYNGKLYIFSASLRTKPVKARYHVASLSDGATVTVYGEKRSVRAINGYFEDDFEPLGVRIYMINKSDIMPIQVQRQ
jgi:hypothetical protein